MKYDFDIAVIGAGSGGLTVAFGLAAAGKKVALIERGPIGGDCTNFGCVPSKALIDIAKSGKYSSLKDALVEVRERREVIRNEETPAKIREHNIELFECVATFKDEHTLSLSGENSIEISAKNIVIATGSRAMKLNIDGLDDEDILTNESIFELTQDIENLVVIGGGYIGCELSESIASLGTKVSIVQRNTQLIPNEERESSELIKNILSEKGIDIYTDFTGKKAENKKLEIISSDEKNTKKISFDKILFALGRIPNVEKLNLEKAGIEFDTHGICVDSYNRTNKKHIFAIGDCVNGNPQFTHWVNNEGRGVVRNILVPIHNKNVRTKNLPSVLYTHNEIAKVGKTKSELLQSMQKEDIVTKIKDFETNDRSKVTNNTSGFVLMHFKRVTGKILGSTIYGENAGEMIGQVTLAMDNNISAYKFSSSIQAYPTKSDLLKRVADSFVIDTISNFKTELKYFLSSYALQIITGLIWISLLVGFLVYKNNTGQSFEEIALGFYNFIAGNPIGIFIFIIAYALRPIILFPASFMTLMSGALFGLSYGIVITVVGATLSATTAYLIGSVFGKKVISGEDTGILGQMKKSANKSPFVSVLLTRLLFFPYDIVNYICGFLRIKYIPFTLATIFGILPGSTVFVLAGAAFYNKELTSFSQAFENIDSSFLYIAAGLFIVTVAFAKLLKKFIK